MPTPLIEHMSVATKSLQIAISAEDREMANAVLAELGLDTPTAVRLFLRQVILTRSIPFPLTAATRIEPVEVSPALQAKADLVGEAMGAYLAKKKPGKKR